MSKISLNQKFAYLFGGIYLLVGLAGFAITGTANFAAHHTSDNLIVFQLNPLHNVVHIAIGLLLLVSARNALTSRVSNVTVGTVYLLVGIIGIFIAGGSNSGNILALNQADNGLHLATAILALGVALSERPMILTSK